MPIRAITFDFWCTLFRDANGAARQQIRIDALQEATGASSEAITKALATVWAEFMRHHIEEQRTLDPIDAVRHAASLLDASLDADVAEKLAEVFATAILAHSPVPIEDALEAVHAAAQRCPVGIVSDTGVSPGSSLRQLLERNGFGDVFTTKVFSDELGVAKPQALMFETAARDLGVNTEELLHIGDLDPTDIEGAKAVGAKAALFAGFNACYVDNTQADYTFLTWRAFLDALPEILPEN